MLPAERDPRGAVARRVLLVAAVSSLAVVVAASILITSVFSSATASLAARESRAADAPSGKPLTIAIARTAGGPSEWRTYARAIQRMSEATGRPMRVRYTMTRRDVADLLRSHEVDAGFLCTNCFVELADEGGISLVAAPMIAGERMDAAVLVVRDSSPYSSLKDLAGHRVGVTEPPSLAGHTYLYWLADRDGIDVARSLDVVQGESQEHNVKALLTGEVDAVVVNRSQLALWNHADLRIVSTSPEFGMPPFVTGSTVDTETRAAMKRSLLSTPASPRSSRSLVQGFAEVSVADYDFAQQLVRFAARMRDSQ